jgi:hypothetical protein
MLLVMAGVVALGRYTDWLDGYALAVLCWGLALVVMGAGLIVLGLLGRRAGSFVAASIILALVAVPVGAGAGVLAVTDGSLSAGSSFSRPQTAAVAANGYSLGIGDLTVDLTDPAILEAGDLTVDVSVGIGNATVVVPGDRSVIVNASLATGQIWAGGLDPDGWSVTWPGLGDGHDWADDYWDGRDWEDRDWVDWDDLSDDPRSVDGIAVSLTAMTEAAADGRQPLLTVDYRGSIGRLRIVEQN